MARKARKAKARGGCKLITFHRGRKAIQVKRCEGRSLSTGAKRRWKRLRGKVICRAKRTGKFKAC